MLSYKKIAAGVVLLGVVLGPTTSFACSLLPGSLAPLCQTVCKTVLEDGVLQDVCMLGNPHSL